MKKIILSISLCLLVFSCNLLHKKDATSISLIVDNVEDIVDKHDDNIQSSIDSKRFDYINEMSEVALDSVRIQLNQLINMEISESQEPLRESAINYIGALQNIINSQKRYSLLTDSTTLEQAEIIDAANLKVIEAAQEEHDIYDVELRASK